MSTLNKHHTFSLIWAMAVCGLLAFVVALAKPRPPLESRSFVIELNEDGTCDPGYRKGDAMTSEGHRPMCLRYP